MSDLTQKFQDIMKDLNEKITDKDQLEYVNKKMNELSLIYIELINRMNEVIEEKIVNIEKVQNLIENKVDKIQTSITGIENDIYEDGFDFEIVCPYCNNEFSADIESKTDIRCPECDNIIELDWNGEESETCSGSCSSCNSGCGEFCEDSDEDEDM